MNTESIISLRQIGTHFHIDQSLIQEFAEFGLYQTIPREGEIGIEIHSLQRVKRVLSLHQVLGVNKEGIDIILELRDQVSRLHQEMATLRHELAKVRRKAELPSLVDLEAQSIVIEIRDID